MHGENAKMNSSVVVSPRPGGTGRGPSVSTQHGDREPEAKIQEGAGMNQQQTRPGHAWNRKEQDKMSSPMR